MVQRITSPRHTVSPTGEVEMIEKDEDEESLDWDDISSNAGSQDSDEEKGQSMRQRVNKLSMPLEMTCKKCKERTMTKVKRKCTCWTVCKWYCLILFFCICIPCICLYIPITRGGAISDYLECKCLHLSVVHHCGACNEPLQTFHPDISGHQDLEIKGDEDCESTSYYDEEDDEGEEGDKNSIEFERDDDNDIQ